MAVFILISMGAVQAAPAQVGWKCDFPLAITKTVSAANKHIAKSVPPPKTAGRDALAAEIKISFPEFSSSAGGNAAVDAMNKAIQSRLFGVLADNNVTSVEQFLKTFIEDYEQALQGDAENIGAWSIMFEATIQYSDENLLSLRILDSLFVGGAHPMSNVTYLVFSLKTGELINLSAFVPEEKIGALSKVAEKHFRKIHSLKPDETYEQAGFLFPQNRFSLNRNFLVAKSGLSFCFNQYEIAPYAMGITELVIPWAGIKSAVNPKGPAGNFLNKH